MISYELAKELKDAGFPQDGSWSLSGTKAQGEYEQGSYIKGTHVPDLVYLPTLTELIEACGRDGLVLRRSEWNKDDGKGWVACLFDLNLTVRYESGDCSTPEESVARLWLSLSRPEKL